MQITLLGGIHDQEMESPVREGRRLGRDGHHSPPRRIRSIIMIRIIRDGITVVTVVDTPAKWRHLGGKVGGA